MNVSDVVFEMELNGVDSADIADIVKLYGGRVLSSELIDEELHSRGYPKIFTIDYDSYDEYGSWEDDEYNTSERFPHKQHYSD
jgi:hypothetical protein